MKRRELLKQSVVRTNHLTLCREGMLESYIPTISKENHAASLLELENGDILAVWFAGSEEGRNDIKIYLSRLAAGELAWSRPERVSNNFRKSEQNPVLFQTPEGKVLLLYTAQDTREMSRAEFNANHKGEYTRQETAVICCRISEDQGYTWGNVQQFSDRPGSFCRSPITILSNGDWIFPMWYSLSDGKTHYGSDYSVVKLSSDQGNSWREYAFPFSRGRVHASIIETAKGQLTAFFRSRSADHIYISHSENYGRAWTAPEKTSLPNNNASIRAIKLHSGRLALIFNHYRANEDSTLTVWPKERYPVTIALSEDNGETWPYMRHIETGDNFYGEQNKHLNRRYEYPWILQSKDGLLHVAYSYGNRSCIKHAIVTEEWVMGEGQEV